MFIVGYATEADIAEIMELGWDVVPAELLGETVRSQYNLLQPPKTNVSPAVRIIAVRAESSVLDAIKEKTPPKTEQLLNLEEFTKEKMRLETELGALRKRCAHKYADGSSMVSPSPHGQGETYCPNCGNKWD